MRVHLCMEEQSVSRGISIRLLIWSVSEEYTHSLARLPTHSLTPPAFCLMLSAHFLLSSPLSHRISISKPEQAPYWQISITKSRRKVWPSMPFTLSIQRICTCLPMTLSDAHSHIHFTLYSVSSRKPPTPHLFPSTHFSFLTYFCFAVITHWTRIRFFFSAYSLWAGKIFCTARIIFKLQET